MSQKKKQQRLQSDGLLDSILGNVTKLHSSLKRPPTGVRGVQEAFADEVASPYLIAKQPLVHGSSSASAMPPPGARDVCRNTECGRSDFEVDVRRGDRICNHCGVVQNSRSIESQEEEHRSFADDDKSESRKRAEVQRGKGGGRVGDKNLSRVAQIATMGGDTDDQLPEKERKRLESYEQKVQALTTHMSLQRQLIDDALHLCERLVHSQLEHDKLCTKLPSEKCRLGMKPKAHAVVAAALVVYALREAGMTRQFTEMEQYLKGDDVRAFRSDIAKIYQLCREHLQVRDSQFSCAQGYKPPVLQDTGKIEDTSVKITGLLPRLCSELRLPYMVETRAREYIETWSREGARALMPQTTAAVALYFAHRAVEPLMRDANVSAAPPLDVNDLATAVGLDSNTVARAIRDREEDTRGTAKSAVAAKAGKGMDAASNGLGQFNESESAAAASANGGATRSP
mmetsp:Transcript_37549/g.62174  ORF Transcript_37549/g.62174 Transcript_37549/m.62174 type:complete len:456 (-) Transcript_37549:347-1714(-)|eukprot:CAMPEP_0119337068 /NCGR_PEP_ID=MMETSP1333-20130426/93205_1 /TAXON_ID=418940 /ORGANISM="Scyphosphaera apsteinii, Strain RCC1455" /LENGTH=455 /DNA_ID=CAMNT_0007348033 /DNA_START=42 /DNA_END=1409 /DNA_ORIENTATION=+